MACEKKCIYVHPLCQRNPLGESSFELSLGTPAGIGIVDSRNHDSELTKESFKTCQVVEYGCGSGSLLHILSLPANHKDDFPCLYPPSPSETPSTCMTPSTSDPLDLSSLSVSNLDAAPPASPPTRKSKLAKLRSLPPLAPEEAELHLRRLVGVDIDDEALKNAVKVIEIPKVEDEDEERFGYGGQRRERWEPCMMEVWKGGIEVYNPGFDGIEAIVASEVRSTSSLPVS